MVFLAALLGAALVAGLWGGLTVRRRRRVAAFHDVVRAGDLTAMRLHVEHGQDVNAADGKGDTALHVAYYEGRQAAVEELTALGADVELRNEDGFRPARMADLRSAETLLTELSALLDPVSGWHDVGQARLLYENLRKHGYRVTTRALANAVDRAEEKRPILLTAIKLGNRSHLAVLGVLLDRYGYQVLAEDYLNSGSNFLEVAAHRWARRYGYTIIRSGRGGAAATWGSF